jgi:N-acetyl-anhydromuramyl-L-alanine amidase AmpD
MMSNTPLKLLALASASGLALLAGCHGPAGERPDSPWASPIELEGARNETLAAVAADTHVPASVLYALAYQQSRFEDPDLLADNPMSDDVALDDPELEAADLDWNDPSRAEDPEQEVGDEVETVDGLEDFQDEIAADPAAEAYELTDDVEGADDLAGVPDDIDTTTEEPSDDELADAHAGFDTAGVFYLTSEQVTWAAQRLSIDEDEVRTDLEANARATAELLTADVELDGSTLENASHRRWEDAMVRFVGLDPADEAGLLAREELRAILENGFDTTTFDGERLMMVQAGGAVLPNLGGWDDEMTSEGTTTETGTGTDVAIEGLTGGYPSVEWIPASSSNYTSGRGGSSIRYVVIHDIEGTMPGAISVFRNPRAEASAHYIVRARDGHIVQMVREQDRAWHAGHWLFNSSAIGIEHEGFADRPHGGGYYTERLYQSSAQLTCAIARRYDIPVDRRHIIGHGNVPSSRSSTTICSDSAANSGACGGASHHHDPGRYWDWRLYMSLVARCASGRPAPSPTPPRPHPVREQRAITTGWGGQRVVVDAGGAVHVFAVDAAHRLVETVRAGATGDFSRFRVIDAAGTLSGYPAAVVSNGRIIVAVRGSDDRVHIARRSAAGAWEAGFTLPGVTINAMPSLFVNRDGRAEVFVRGDDNELHHAAERMEGGDFGQWWSLGGHLRSMPTVVADAQGRPHVFAIGDSSGHIWTRVRTAPTEWPAWTYLNARGNAPVSPVLMSDGRLGVFTRNPQGRLVSQFTETDGRWRTPHVIGGVLTSNVVATLDSHDRVNVFGRGTDGAIYRIVRNAGGRWGSFARLGGHVTMGPAVVRTSVGLEVFTAGRNHALYHAYQTRGTHSGWAGWHGHGGRLGWL